ncbi:mannose-1-phosphate guanylyltransferase [Salinimicrobium tongyeongense]|uniref:Mannose-1-phosphate guanylyltransferase n=1 Tax=Salinimicrobium tongyeongense TaxID=2809707 RepID=A0ABY6NN25_9FLAO|nr:mannose-1-phosphate guanylyltransferase [Salinimicrobium tongyeongense]UZH54289.1 mannose-1-phosphate guanylyltransferase [Salinimicrobium tongyeongense]
MKENNFAILMAGGVGSRFWPVSTAAKPKQFRDLLGRGETLIQTTFRRLSQLVPSKNIYVLTNERYDHLVKQQLPQLDEEQIVLEPVMRNTAPAVLLASLKIWKKNSKAVMIMAPSDHWIEDEQAFHNDLTTAFEAARGQDKILTLGIKPTFPNTGYGYIKFDPLASGRVKPVELFTEKPSYAVAKDFLKSGNFLWNAGIFVWNAAYILRAFQKNLQQTFDLFSKGAPVFNTSEEKDFIKQNYPEAENISIDYAILEKEQGTIEVIPASFDWNDLGTWGSLYEETVKDADGNIALNARLFAENATGNLISSDKNKVVVLEGMNDYVIVDENEVLLIVPREKEQDIKRIRESVKEKFGENLG